MILIGTTSAQVGRAPSIYIHLCSNDVTEQPLLHATYTYEKMSELVLSQNSTADARDGAIALHITPTRLRVFNGMCASRWKRLVSWKSRKMADEEYHQMASGTWTELLPPW